jgi:hypothetical protein
VRAFNFSSSANKEAGSAGTAWEKRGRTARDISSRARAGTPCGCRLTGNTGVSTDNGNGVLSGRVGGSNSLASHGRGSDDVEGRDTEQSMGRRDKSVIAIWAARTSAGRPGRRVTGREGCGVNDLPLGVEYTGGLEDLGGDGDL